MLLSTVKFIFIARKEAIEVIRVESLNYFAPDADRFHVGEIEPMYAQIH
ncbi:hypothetical protein [Chroococcidiopsis sp. CCNUC1]|jgi:hypothetical protein|nr:hypothetical protein [Chroococcidiopsis sp. CCNUC1]URD53634.1 hypothetical protein M5J74_30155 [Chroococcidiopsis sp. CCNUC1]